MKERLRNVLGWTSFLLLSYWVLILSSSIVLDWNPQTDLDFLILGLGEGFVWVPPLISVFLKVVEYVVWGGFRFRPWRQE
jgi:hypothetical protein